MRAQIAGYIGHLDSSIERLESVSHALTATGEGVEALQRSVLAAASAIGGGEARAALFTIDDGSLEAAAGASAERAGRVRREEVASAGAGRARAPDAGDASPGLLAVPMMYHAEVVGALAVWSFDPLSDSDERALAALANNASVATENTRLFEQERETVQRLRELDILKTNFLTTTQHELRTPVLAIKGEIELITAAWQQLDEPTKLELVRDMEISARLLGDIVENIVVFSLLNSEAVTLRTEHVDVAAAINVTAAQLRENFKDGLPVELTLNLTPQRVHRRRPRAVRAGDARAARQRREVHAGGRPRLASRRGGWATAAASTSSTTASASTRSELPDGVRPSSPGGRLAHPPLRRHGHGPGAGTTPQRGPRRRRSR